MDLSFQEKSVWGSIVSLVAVYGWYVKELLSAYPAIDASLMAGLLLTVVVLIIVIEAALHIAIAIRSRPAPEDERDRLIQTRAHRNAYYVLAVGTVVAIGQVVIGEAMNATSSVITLERSLLAANILLLAFVLAELVALGSQLVYYRRGI